jgi:hypothetical protein
MSLGSIITPVKKVRSKRKLRILFSLIILVPVLVIICASPLIKYCVEKYDVEYTGREIRVDRPYLNPFTGYISFHKLKISELDSDSIFLKANCVNANFSVYKLFYGTIEITELNLVDPVGTLIQNKKETNLDDIIRKFSPKRNSKKNKEPLKLSILSVKIHNGEIHYRDVVTPVHVFIKKLHMECSGIRWNSDTVAASYSFLSGIDKGGMKGYFSVNTKNLDYKIQSKIDHLDLNFINQYIKDLANYGKFKGIIDADVNTKGNFKNAEVLSATGKVCFCDFHFEDHKGEDCLSFESLKIGITLLDPNAHKYTFDSVLLIKPYLKYEQYDCQSNMVTMFYKKGLGGYVSKNPERFNLIVVLGDYLKEISKNFFKSNYQVNRLAVTNGRLLYNNYSLNEKFSIATDSLSLSADSIDKTRKMVELKLKTLIKPYGDIDMSLNINPKDSSDFDLVYHLKDLPLAMFNPYLISYTSFPVDRGTLELKGKWNVRNGYIKSANHLLVIDPRISKRIRHKNSKWIPMPLVMAFVRERGNIIDYEIPISGNMKHPHFNFKDVILDLVKNMFVKPPTTPYEYTVKNIENRIERSHSLKWTMGQCVLENDQNKFVEDLANYLHETPGAHLSIFPMEYSEKEKEYILFFLAKKKYYLSHQKNKTFDPGDSLEVDKMNSKDPAFIKYITAYCKDPMLFTVQEKCIQYVGQALIEQKLAQLREKRKEAFLYYFKENKTNTRVIIHALDDEIPYNGFSFFKILYDKGVPASLNDVYERMADLNTKSPRKKYQSKRQKNKNSSH